MKIRFKENFSAKIAYNICCFSGSHDIKIKKYKKDEELEIFGLDSDKKGNFVIFMCDKVSSLHGNWFNVPKNIVEIIKHIE